MHIERPLPPVTLVLGGVRSGKSVYAEQLVTSQGNGIYLATAEARDEEMAQRIEQHKERRGEVWTTVEEPLDLLLRLEKLSRPKTPVLVDCLTLWLSNLMEAGQDVTFETERLLRCLPTLVGPVVLVSNEIGLGGIAGDPPTRRFADSLGLLNQTVGLTADKVVLITAGLPVVLKDVERVRKA